MLRLYLICFGVYLFYGIMFMITSEEPKKGLLHIRWVVFWLPLGLLDAVRGLTKAITEKKFRW